MPNDGFSKFICSDCEAIVNNFSIFCSLVKEVQTQYLREKNNTLEANHRHYTKKKCSKLNSNQSDQNTPTVSIGPDGMIECILCKMHLDAIEHTTLHMVTHGIGTVICCCQLCGEKGDLTKFINKHKTTGNKVSSVWCYSCSFYETATPTTIGDKVSSTKVHICEVCSKSFRSHAHLLRHKLIHSGSKPFLCEVCGEGFSQRSSLKLHVSSHSGLNPHKCSQCGQTFRFKVSLISHLLSMHSHGAVGKRKAYSCDRCGKLLATKYKLCRHYRSHTGERPYECPRCSRFFSQTGNLNLHLKKHYEEDAGTAQEIEPYTLQLLTKPTDPVQYIPHADHNLLNNSDPKFLESIFQDHSVVSCENLASSRNPLSGMDNALIKSSATESSHESQYIALGTDFGPSSNNVTPSEYLGIPISNSNEKSVEHKRSLELFTNYSQNSLLFIDESANLQDATSNSEGVSLPTFSSLQAGTSTSNLPHSHSTL